MINHLSPIIIVEDNAMDGEIARRAIQKLGSDNPVLVIEDGLRAIDQLLGNPVMDIEPLPHPQLIILDINLPGLGGIEVLSRLRASDRHHHTVVVMVSSSTDQKDILQSYQSGCNSYVTKPANTRTLYSMYWQLTQYWTSLNLTPAPRNP